MKLKDFAPSQKVRLYFEAENDRSKTGKLVTTVEHALNPNASQHFFPPAGETPVSLDWGMPYWYAHEAVAFELV